MGGGSVNDPHKTNYHLEISTDKEEVALRKLVKKQEKEFKMNDKKLLTNVLLMELSRRMAGKLKFNIIKGIISGILKEKLTK